MPLLLDAMPDPDEGVRAVAATYLGILHEDAGGVGAAADGRAQRPGSSGASGVRDRAWIVRR